MESLIADILPRFKVPYGLKPLQQQSITHLAEGRNIFSVLPTGYGKSDIYGWFPVVMDEMNSQVNYSMALIISPLRALSRDQVQRWNTTGVSSIAIGHHGEMETEDIEDIKAGKYRLLFASPESVTEDKWSSLICKIQSRICLLVIDEAHCLELWGNSFRTKYKRVRELRALLGARVPVACLTATATPLLIESVKESLGILEMEHVVMVPDRRNIFLTWRKEKANPMDLEWIVDKIVHNGQATPKMVIYCRTVDIILKVYKILVKKLIALNHDEKEEHIEMFHGQLDEKAQELITSEFKAPDSMIRVLISTVAFGMGVQMNDVSEVVHWGPPSSVLAYWQEVGRCARDGSKGRASLYLPPRSVDKRTVSEDMIKLLSFTGTCIRAGVLKALQVDGISDSSIESCTGGVSCCNVCSSTCDEVVGASAL